MLCGRDPQSLNEFERRGMVIIGINSSDVHSCNDNSCIIQVGCDVTINEEDIPDVSSAQIFRVPRLTPYYNHALYTPHLVSIGPFHYGKKDLQGLENSKSEAVRRMQKRIQRRNPHISMKSIVEQHILLKDKKIRDFYGEHIPLTSTQLAWMVTRDACFVYEFLVNYIKVSSDNRDICEITQVSQVEYVQSFYEEEVSSFKWKYDAVFDADIQNPMRERLMSDMLLFENQVPLWVLKDLIKFQVDSAGSAKQKVENLMNMLISSAARHELFIWKARVPYKLYCKKHVLEVVYRSMVGDDLSSSDDGELLDLLPSFNNHKQTCYGKWLDSMKAICGHFPSFSEKKMPCNNVYLKLPTASELVRGGVKIQPMFCEDIERAVGQHPTRLFEYSSAIRWMRFEEKTSVLYLPQIRVTSELDRVTGSIGAMEVGIRGYGTKPMIQFMLLMDELIENQEDVAVLRKAGVINNFFGSNQEVADLFNLAKGIAHFRGCKPIDEVRIGLHKYTRRKYKKLWSEFLNAYFSKPWQLAGSMAAVLLILMAAGQDLCLFFTCNSDSS